MQPTEILIKPLRNNAMLPERATAYAAGWDVRAYADPSLLPQEMQYLCALDASKKHIVARVGRVTVIPLGFALAMPDGWEAQVRPRSGLSIKSALIQVPTIGTIDADFRGCVSACYYNAGKTDVIVEHGQRIAQLVFQRVPSILLTVARELPESLRGEQGWGSTGNH